jgi:hypothetical protein
VKIWAVDITVSAHAHEQGINILAIQWFGFFKELKDAKTSVEKWYSTPRPGKEVLPISKGWDLDDDGDHVVSFIEYNIIDGEKMGQEAHVVRISKRKVN